jgi:hypothetical protein
VLTGHPDAVPDILGRLGASIGLAILIVEAEAGVFARNRALLPGR